MLNNKFLFFLLMFLSACGSLVVGVTSSSKSMTSPPAKIAVSATSYAFLSAGVCSGPYSLVLQDAAWEKEFLIPV